MPPKPGWIKNGDVVPFVKPGSSVRVRFLAPVSAEWAEVFWIPERAIQRVCVRLNRDPGKHKGTLRIQKQPNAAGDIVTETFKASNPNEGKKPAEFVALAEGAPVSTPLAVADELYLGHKSASYTAEGDPALALAAALGPIGFLAGIAAALAKLSPIKLTRQGKQATHTGFVRAAVDPEFVVRVLGMTSSPSLQDYLKDYLPSAAKELEIDSQEFETAFYDEFSDYLVDAHPGFEIQNQRLSLDAGEEKEVRVDIFPNDPCRMMFALAAVRNEEIISVSDLVSLTVAGDGEVEVDF
jgi:hypothetical protein